jgi:hypothetical protein
MADKQNAQFDFSGQWVPSLNPLKIGSENFSQLDNMSYINNGVEMCLGYSKINSTALTTYYKGRDGIHLRTPYSQASEVLVSCLNAAGTAAYINTNTTAIPGTGDFGDDPVYQPSAVGGRWSKFSHGVGYANGTDAAIYAGQEMRTASFIRCTAAPSGFALTGSIDYTEQINNALTDSLNTCTITAASAAYIMIGSTRPISAVKMYVSSANDTTASISGYYWNGSAWTALSGLDDKTSVGGKALATTGWIWFAEDGSAAESLLLSNSKQATIEETRLYYYYLVLSAGAATVYQVTAHAPMQKVRDVWDGIYRDCINAYTFRSSKYDNFTQEVNTLSSAEYPIAMKAGGLTSSDGILLGCQERACGIRFEFIAGLTNAVSATITVQYHNGTTWASLTSVNDGTSLGGATMGQTGTVTWEPPSEALEHKNTRFGTTAYHYAVSFSATLTDGTEHDGVSIDSITFIPAEKQVYPFKFPFEFQGHAMLCNFEKGQEGNRVDYSMKNAPDVWNGDDSSAMAKSLYFGGYEDLTAASSIYNRFGSSIYEIALFLKQNETYLLNGSGPEDFRIFKISTNYGCPAPYTVATAEVAYSVSEELQRNICIWLSYKGPVVFDGAVIKPISGVDIYFDERQSTCINYEAIESAYGAFDPHNQEYHLLMPCGEGQTTINTWLVYDVQRQRWYKKVVDGAALYPQCLFTVKSETGVGYLYGMTDSGYMMRINHGTTWAGVDMVHRLKTAAITPTGSIWDECRVRKFKLVHEVPDFDESTDEIEVVVECYADGSDTEPTHIFDPFVISEQSISQAILLEFDGGGTFYFNSGEQFTVGKSGKRSYYDEKQSCNVKGLSFSFEFSQTSNAFSYLGNFGKRMLGWGFQWEKERERP